MKATSIPVETDFQRLIVEQALALARELERTAATAPHGRVLQRAEGSLLTRGRDFLRGALEQLAQATADEAVKKGGRPGPAAGDLPGTKATPRAPS